MNMTDKISQQVNALNCMVLEYCVPKVYGEAPRISKIFRRYQHNSNAPSTSRRPKQK